MRWSLYKKYFSVDVNYQSGTATNNAGLMIIPSASTLQVMKGHNLGYHCYEGGILVHFQGAQDDTDPKKIIPENIIDDNQALFFKLYFDNTALLKELNFFPDPANIKYGFPLIYLGEKTGSSSAVELKYQGVIIKPAVCSFQVKDSDCGLASKDEANFNIKDQKGNSVYTNTSKKDDDGYFTCSIDMRNQQIGFYTLQIGSSSTNFFADTSDEFQGCIAVIKILKLPFDTDWTIANSNNYVKFSKTINKK